MSDAKAAALPVPQPVLFYDGDCGFCNGSVAFVLRHEKQHHLLFAPLQGETAAVALPVSGLPADIGQKSIVLYDNDNFFIRSRAAFRAMKHMGGIWKIFAAVLSLIPTAITDLGYRAVARYRGHIPYKKSCDLLPPEQQKRFLP